MIGNAPMIMTKSLKNECFKTLLTNTYSQHIRNFVVIALTRHPQKKKRKRFKSENDDDNDNNQ
ncbi:hypothetical protein BLOT_013605 [Blomia tropicalis]|nr:hypothetical protein BLOT_013605 [Blomia tropicalis]